MTSERDDTPISADVYDRLASEYDDITGAAIREHYEWPVVRSLLPPLDGLHALDAACGNGFYTERLVDAGATAVGIDASTEMVSRARQRFADDARVTITQADLTADLSDLDDEAFDLVVCQLALEHVEHWAAVFSTFARVLQPGGRVVVSTSHTVRDYVDAEFDVRDHVLADSAAYGEIERVDRDWGESEETLVPFYRRPLGAVFGPPLEAGLHLDALVEPTVTDEFANERPELAKEFREGPPNFLCLRFLKPA